MKICYTDKNFNEVHQGIIDYANKVVGSYMAQGFKLTLRQLYYQFVKANAFPTDWVDPTTGSTNCERSYKKLGDIISDARMAGLIDWESIEDRGRESHSNSHWDTPASIIASAAQSFAINKWMSQPNYVEVWVEKDALVGVLEQACRPLDVRFFACKGYTSQSAMWEAAQRFVDKDGEGKVCHIIHLGDHDPSGIDMTRDIRDRLETFCNYHGATPPEVSRIALNKDQIEEFNPPPNPAKVTDSRAKKYIEEFGEESWELDALEPNYLVEIIQTAVINLRDEDLWEEAVAQEKKHKLGLDKASRQWDKVEEFLKV